MKWIKFHIILICFLGGFNSLGQNNFLGINIQGQVFNSGVSAAEIQLVLIDTSGALAWNEVHPSVDLDEQGAFALVLGQGNYLGGTHSDFSTIDWFGISSVEVYNYNGGSPLFLMELSILSHPYAYHSLTTLTIPSIFALTDNITAIPIQYNLLRFDGTNFYTSDDWLGDSAIFAWNGLSATYTDTVTYGYSGQTAADSSLHSNYSDTTNYAIEALNAVDVEQSVYSDTALIALVSDGNWKFLGNADLSLSQFIGSTDGDFNLRTNNQTRLAFKQALQINNVGSDPGFSLELNEGFLVRGSGTSSFNNLAGTFMWYNPIKKSVIMGETMHGLDSSQGNWSFVFGLNAATNGRYSTVIGNNSYGDSSLFGGTMYEALSSVSIGRHCHSSRYCVAIGDSAIADYYRNVAIGRKVIANNQSASLGIGDNVVSIGATTWAMGHNVGATANFSTVLGTNASSGSQRGSFVFGDRSTNDTVYNTADHQFMVRAAGGVIFYTASDLSMGVELAPGGGSWNMVSDRNKKRNIQPIDLQKISEKFHDLPVYAWKYKGQEIWHVGPMAQDVYKAFQVGELPNYINMIDIDGITFLGIKSIREKLISLDLQEEINELETQVENEKNQLDNIDERINALYEKINL